MTRKASFPRKAKEADSKPASAWYQQVDNIVNSAYSEVLGTSNQVVATGSAPSLTLSLSEELILPGSGAVVLPSGTTAERPSSPANGSIRWNTSTELLEYFFDASWESIIIGQDVATIANMEAATSTTLMVTPGRQMYHPAHPKVTVNFNGTGTVAIRDSHNVSSITDNGTGDYTVNFSVTFASVIPLVTTSDDESSPGGAKQCAVHTRATTSVRVVTGYSGVGLEDSEGVAVLVCGELA